MKEKLKYLLSGALAGVVNGVLGAGGGVILVPLLMSYIKLEERKAFATSVFIILPISIVSACVYFYTGRMDLGLAAPYLAGGFAGGIIAGRYMKNMPTVWLRRTFGAVLIIGGIRSIFF